MSATRSRLVHVVDRQHILPGPFEGEQEDWVAPQYDWAKFDCPLSKTEAGFLVYERLISSGTYSMQQSDFERMGFAVVENKVQIPDDYEVVGILTEDRYDIFEPGTKVTAYLSLMLWRSSPHHPLSATTPESKEEKP